MRSIQIGLMFWFLLLCFHDAAAIVCKDPNLLASDSEPLPYQKELEGILDAYEKDDVQRMDEMLKMLGVQQETIDMDEEEISYSTDPLLFVPNRVQAEGYPIEEHEVVTDDGYILHLYRMPHGRKEPATNQTRPPVLMVHGLYDSSMSWVALGADNSLAYLLAEAGYDVWLANVRGTQPSRTHVRLSATGLWQKAYWSFTWHEIGVYDIPAMIDHILDTTNQKSLNYIGFSQGTTTFLVMSSMRPDYNEKIFDAHLIGPVATPKHQYNDFFNTLARFYKLIKRISQVLRIYKITDVSSFFPKMFDMLCDKFASVQPCKSITELISSNSVNCSYFYDMKRNMVGGGSIRQAWHFLQLIRNGGFRQFDYEDKSINMKVYGRETPPEYNLTKVTAPVNLYYSKDDDVATMKNAIDLQHKLQNHRSSYVVPFDGFQHIDFTYSRYIRELINKEVIRKMNESNRL